jgi:hypothetical protein
MRQPAAQYRRVVSAPFAFDRAAARLSTLLATSVSSQYAANASSSLRRFSSASLRLYSARSFFSIGAYFL